ncbi:hypothetical protein, partial [Paraburkholderia ribeironis]|uniref:hypothetical protein n=1 Tax=Paraburkholderia ribeironis TaxID=1247936 RepID=UPI001C3F8770
QQPETPPDRRWGFCVYARRARGAKRYRQILQDPAAGASRNDSASAKRKRGRKNTVHDTSWRISVAYTANNASALSTAVPIRKR